MFGELKIFITFENGRIWRKSRATRYWSVVASDWRRHRGAEPGVTCCTTWACRPATRHPGSRDITSAWSSDRTIVSLP